MSDSNLTNIQLLPPDEEQPALPRPDNNEQAVSEYPNNEEPESQALQIILNDHIMTKLHSSGDLNDFTLKCMQQSCNILKPQVMQDIDGKSEGVEDQEEKAQDNCQDKIAASQIRNESSAGREGTGAVPLIRFNHNYDHDKMQNANRAQSNNELHPTYIDKALCDDNEQPLKLNQRKQGQEDLIEQNEITGPNNQTNKRAYQGERTDIENSDLEKHRMEGENNGLNQIAKTHLMNRSATNLPSADPLNHMNQDLILDQSISRMDFEGSPQKQPNSQPQTKKKGAKSTFQKHSKREKMAQQSKQSSSNRTKLQLPSVTKIEEVIGISKQSVIEHILTKKRDQKHSDKSEKKKPLDRQLMQPEPLLFNQSKATQSTPNLNTFTPINPSAMGVQAQTSDTLLANLQQEIDFNNYLQQQLLMQDIYQQNQQQQTNLTDLSTNQFGQQPLTSSGQQQQGDLMQINLQNSLNSLFQQQMQNLQMINNQSLSNQSAPQYPFMNFNFDAPNFKQQQQLLQNLSKSTNSLDSLRLAIMAQDTQNDENMLLKSFSQQQLLNQQHLSQQHHLQQQMNQSLLLQQQQQQQIEHLNNSQGHQLLPPLNPFLAQYQQQMAQSQLIQHQNQFNSFDSQISNNGFMPNTGVNCQSQNPDMKSLMANNALNNPLLQSLISQNKSQSQASMLNHPLSGAMGTGTEGVDLGNADGNQMQPTLLEQWQLLQSFLKDPQVIESLNLDQLTLSQMQTKLLPELQKSQLLQDYKQVSMQEGQTSLSFLPIMNQDPCAFVGSVEFNKKRLVERIDDIDHEIIRNFAQKIIPPQPKSSTPPNHLSSAEEKIEEKKKEKYLKRSKKERQRLIKKSEDKQKQLQVMEQKEEDNNKNRALQKDKTKSNEIYSQQLLQFGETSASQKSMHLSMSKLPLNMAAASSSTIPKQSASAAGSSKQLAQRTAKRASLRTSNSTIIGRPLQKHHKKGGLCSHPETDSEGREDEDSEDREFQKKLSRSLKNDTQRSSSNQLSQKGAAEQMEAESELRPQRPKRAGAQTSRYFGYEQMASSKHEHSHYQLISYANYKSLAAQPFVIYISVEAQIVLNVHSHLSEYEVIGFLGGYCFESQNSNQKYLIISTVIPCDSLIENQVERQKNVDLCPVSANNARQIIHSRGQQVLGWYHSHPFFPVEPSLIDIRNHAVYQKNFDLENLPFVALIIGPYSTRGRNESLQRVFHLVKEKQPFSLIYKQMPARKLRKALLRDLEEIFRKYKSHKDKINLKEKWAAGQSRQDKLIAVIDQIMDKNLRQKDKTDIQQDLFSNLSAADYQSFSQQGQQPERSHQQVTPDSAAARENQDSQGTSSEDWNSDDLSNDNQEGMIGNGNQLAQMSSLPRDTVANHFSTGTTGTTLESNFKFPEVAHQCSSALQQRKDPFFSVENHERVDKFMVKIKTILQRELFGEVYVPSDEDE